MLTLFIHGRELIYNVEPIRNAMKDEPSDRIRKSPMNECDDIKGGHNIE